MSGNEFKVNACLEKVISEITPQSDETLKRLSSDSSESIFKIIVDQDPQLNEFYERFAKESSDIEYSRRQCKVVYDGAIQQTDNINTRYKGYLSASVVPGTVGAAFIGLELARHPAGALVGFIGGVAGITLAFLRAKKNKLASDPVLKDPKGNYETSLQQLDVKATTLKETYCKDICAYLDGTQAH